MIAEAVARVVVLLVDPQMFGVLVDVHLANLAGHRVGKPGSGRPRLLKELDEQMTCPTKTKTRMVSARPGLDADARGYNPVARHPSAPGHRLVIETNSGSSTPLGTSR